MGCDNENTLIDPKNRLLSQEIIIKENNYFMRNLFMKYKNFNCFITKTQFSKMANDLIDESVVKIIFKICASKNNKLLYNDFLYFLALLKTKQFDAKMNFLLYFIFEDNKKLSKESYISNVNKYYGSSYLLYKVLSDEQIINNKTISKEDVFNYVKKNFQEDIEKYELNKELCSLDLEQKEDNEDNDNNNKNEITIKKNSINEHLLNTDKKYCLCMSLKSSICSSMDFYRMNSSLYNKYDSLKGKFDEYKKSNNNMFPLTLLKDMFKEINVVQSLIDLICNYIIKKSQKGIVTFELFKEVISILTIPLDDEEEKAKNKQIFADGLFLLFSYPNDYIEQTDFCNFIQSTKNDYNLNNINYLFNKYQVQKKITKNNFRELIDFLINELIESLEHIKYIPYIFFNFKIIDKKIEKHCIDILLNGEDINKYIIKKIGTDNSFYIIDCNFWDNWKELVNMQNPEENNNKLKIQTENICDQNGIINEGLIYAKDFMILSKRIYNLFCNWYGEPFIEIEREKVLIEDEDNNSSYQKLEGEDLTTHKKYEIEIYPVFLLFLNFQDVQRTCNHSFTAFKAEIKKKMEKPNSIFYKFSKKVKFAKLLNILQESVKMELDENNSRLWIFSKESLEEVNLNDSLEKYGIFNKTVILLEINKNGVWPMDEFELKNKEAKEEKTQLVGIENLGNSCYMNAVLQIFLNTSDIKDILRQIKNDQNFLNFFINYKSEKSKLVEEFIKLLIQKWINHKETISPKKFRKICGMFNENFKECIQQDAYEFYVFLVQHLHEGSNIKTKEITITNKTDDDTSENELGNEYWANTIRNNASYIYGLFIGQLQSKLICSKCHKSKIKYEPYSGLDLPLPEEENIILYIKLFRLPLKLRQFNNDRKEENNIKIKKIKLLNNASEGNIIDTHKTINSNTQHNQRLDFLSTMSSKDEVLTNELNVNIPIMIKIEISRKKKCEELITTLKSMNELCLDTNNLYTKFVILSNNVYISTNLVIDDVFESSEKIEIYELLTYEGIKNIFNYNDLERKDYSKINGEDLNSEINTADINIDLDISNNKEEMVKEALVEIKHRVSKNREADDFIVTIPLFTEIKTHRDYIILLNKNSIKIYDLYEMMWEKYRYFCDIPAKIEKNIWWRNILNEEEEKKDNDSIKKQYCSPFMLKIIKKKNGACPYCPWFEFCNGCILDPTYKEYISIPKDCYLIVEWCQKIKSRHIKDENPLLCLNHSSMKKKEIEQNNDTNKISIYDCFDLFTKDEILEDIVCENCKEKQVFTKNLRIERIPKYLVLSLKRFKITMMKNAKLDCPIKFPLKNINLDKYLVNNSQENSKIYDLFAVINHNGSLTGGHYNCIIKQNNRWIKYNDSTVSYLSRTFDTQEAYILVYKLIENNKYNKLNFNFMGLMDTAYKIYLKQLKFEHIFNYLINNEGEIIEEYKENCEFYYGEPVIVDNSKGYIVSVSENDNGIYAKIRTDNNYLNIKYEPNKIIKETIKDNNSKSNNINFETLLKGSDGCTIY